MSITGNDSSPSSNPGASDTRISLGFDRGSIVVHGLDRAGAGELELVWDGRIEAMRGHARHYRQIVWQFTRQGIAWHDTAKRYPDLRCGKAELPSPYPHQQEAFAAWRKGKRGVVELPTGSGKTQLALMAIAEVQRATLVLVPTLELVAQWCRVLETQLGITPGVVGGGSHDIRPLTVCTYASAYRHGPRFGDRFCLLVFDECHHLAGEGYATIADAMIAPYRLGLSATLERPDARHLLLDDLIGPVVYRKPITELRGAYLAPYRTEVREVTLGADERERYTHARNVYLEFTRRTGITVGSAGDWQRFIFAACRSEQGREAMRAFYEQKHIAYAAQAKFDLCAELLERHRDQRVLIFTNDNRTAYALSWRFLLPLITHQTRVKERRVIMAKFNDKSWPVLVTSKVLNEGVDVPAAAVAIIFSGNASVREHVQRLGRILRKDGKKQAVLYELLTANTGERHTSRKRREHDAYR